MCYYFSKSRSVVLARERYIEAEQKREAGNDREKNENSGRQEKEAVDKKH